MIFLWNFHSGWLRFGGNHSWREVREFPRNLGKNRYSRKGGGKTEVRPPPGVQSEPVGIFSTSKRILHRKTSYQQPGRLTTPKTFIGLLTFPGKVTKLSLRNCGLKIPFNLRKLLVPLGSTILLVFFRESFENLQWVFFHEILSLVHSRLSTQLLEVKMTMGTSPGQYTKHLLTH